MPWNRWERLRSNNVDAAPAVRGHYEIRNSDTGEVLLARTVSNMRAELKRHIAKENRADHCLQDHGGDEFMTLTPEEMEYLNLLPRSGRIPKCYE